MLEGPKLAEFRTSVPIVRPLTKIYANSTISRTDSTVQRGGAYRTVRNLAKTNSFKVLMLFTLVAEIIRGG